jgi:large subunit ribosomal protein L15
MSKKRRQRGSRTHGGGSHKNRRGAGHRGGRGAAGRDKHEFHNYEPLGKHGFTRPESVQDEVLEISVQKLDEDIALYAADGVAEETDHGYRIDARDVVEDGYEADAVKVLGGGQVRNQLEIVADAFSASARALIEEEGGDATLSERAERAEEEEEEDEPQDVSQGEADGE